VPDLCPQHDRGGPCFGLSYKRPSRLRCSPACMSGSLSWIRRWRLPRRSTTSFPGRFRRARKLTTEELAPYAGMREVGTFLVTEVAHGNNAAGVKTIATYDRATFFTLHTPATHGATAQRRV